MAVNNCVNDTISAVIAINGAIASPSPPVRPIDMMAGIKGAAAVATAVKEAANAPFPTAAPLAASPSCIVAKFFAFFAGILIRSRAIDAFSLKLEPS